MTSDVYYIAVHHKPGQLAWLLETLDNPDDIVLLHVDRRAPARVAEQVAELVADRPNTHLVKRHAVRWGTWSQVGAELAAIRTALALSPSWRYFIFLSGQDYPIQDRTSIETNLDRAWPRSFIRVVDFDQIRQTEPDDPHLRRKVVVRLGRRLQELPVSLPGVQGAVTDVKGSQWHILARPFCEWVVDAPMAGRLRRRLRFSQIPDETYFQAAIMSSPFSEERMEDCGRFVVWPGPKTLDSTDLPAMLSSGDLFARKLDEDVDREVLVSLARTGGYREPTSASVPTP